MPRRRNYSTKEIIEIDPLDLQIAFEQAARDGASPVQDGGSNVDVIGVPTNLRIVSQEVVDYFGEYRVNVVVEFDSVPGADEYQAQNIQTTPNVGGT